MIRHTANHPITPALHLTSTSYRTAPPPVLQLPTAAEVAKCLESVTEAQQRLQEALQELRDEGGEDGHGVTSWKAFLCELRALSVSATVGPTVLGARRGCLVAGDDSGGTGAWRKKWDIGDSAAVEAVARRDASKAARFLLAELVPLEGVQVRMVYRSRTDHSDLMI